MNPDGLPEKPGFVEYSINYIRDALGAEDIYSLLTDDGVWEEFAARAHFSRAEAEEVWKGLVVQETLRAVGNKDLYQQEREFGERFVAEFPRVNSELEHHIAQLRALADKADQAHRGCTISKLVASCVAILSEILTILGIGLAPVTTGVSLGLTITGVALGTASAVTDGATDMVEQEIMSAIEADASELTSTGVTPEDALRRFVCVHAPKVVSLGKNVAKCVEDIEKNAIAFSLIRSNPDLAAQAKRLMNSINISAQEAKQVQNAFEGTVLAMSKGARRTAMFSASVSLLADVYSAVRHSLHLQEGAETESASRLRAQASELEKKLEDLQAIHAALLED